MIEQTALEAFAAVLRLERELDVAARVIVVQKEHLAFLDGVRLKAQREAEKWKMEYEIEREALIRYTSAMCT